jgi:hypothetical protein
MKVDIEGAEYALFESISDSIWNKFQRVVMETHNVNGRTSDEIVVLLQRKGFDVSFQGDLLWAVRTGVESSPA